MIKIIKKEDDPLALRASIGGDAVIGYYLVYRGDEDAVASMIAEVLGEFIKGLGK